MWVDSWKDNQNAQVLWNYIYNGTHRQNGQSVISEKSSQVRAEVVLSTTCEWGQWTPAEK